ncbi:MAG: hypothetical protein KAT56_03370, partial [Sedimentisphaerales bacterium]|nr:hypothetical protein [Sedimentisphaerales bacterium]
KNVSLKPNFKTAVEVEVDAQSTKDDENIPHPDTKVQNGDYHISAVPLKDFERGLIEQILDLVKQIEKKYPTEATHWPAGPGLYHVDAQGQVTVWHYQHLWQRSTNCADDEVGWGSSRLVKAMGMYYLPDGTPLQSRWRERGNGMKDIRVKVGRTVEKEDRVALIHRHRLPNDYELLSRDERIKRILLDYWNPRPIAAIVRVDKPARLSGWSIGDIQHFDNYDQLLVTGPPGSYKASLFVSVSLPEGIDNQRKKGASNGRKTDVQVVEEEPLKGVVDGTVFGPDGKPIEWYQVSGTFFGSSLWF